jgi:hypothetical protein
VDAARLDPPTPRARAVARTAQQQEQERSARKQERRIWRRNAGRRRLTNIDCVSSKGSPPSDSGELIVVVGGGRGERRGEPP